MYSFGEAVGRFFRHYFKFHGRATRAEYWWPQLMIFIVLFCVIFAVVSSGLTFEEQDGLSTASLLLIAAGIFLLAVIIPNISVSVRRFHDLDQSGWLVLVFLIAGSIIPGAGLANWIWFAFKGTDGPNKYGPDPFGYSSEVFG